MRRSSTSGPSSRRWAVGAVLVVLAATGCSSGDDAGDPAPSAAPSAAASASPSAARVSLTGGGAELELGAPATVLLRRGDQDPGIVDVSVGSVTRGRTADLTDFGVADAETSQPWYVAVKATNRGTSDLGGASLPLAVLDAEGETWGATPVVGTLRQCPSGTLPATFAPEATADLCLLFLLPEGGTTTSVELTSPSLSEPISWAAAPAS
ncbi:MAG: hypothetical protein Q7T56_12840 [Nocardioidaceae bacterium]|nr:hypothetical protein [Nocardioidaceae bacterium]